MFLATFEPQPNVELSDAYTPEARIARLFKTANAINPYLSGGHHDSCALKICMEEYSLIS